jgi:hypothetical protein
MIGNIHSMDDSRESAAGLFYATSVREKRIFIRPGIITPRPDCRPHGYNFEELMEKLSQYHPSRYPIFILDLDIMDYDFAWQECFDCRLMGGTTKKPDFWNE